MSDPSAKKRLMNFRSSQMKSVLTLATPSLTWFANTSKPLSKKTSSLSTQLYSRRETLESQWLELVSGMWKMITSSMYKSKTRTWSSLSPSGSARSK
jgi:hypothetical protein